MHTKDCTSSTILLHRQHSWLDTSAAHRLNSCAPHQDIVEGHGYNIHSAKIIQAAKNISGLIVLPVPLVQHTHFFTCVITLASIVHLSRWAAMLPLRQDEALKQTIRLQSGALKTIAHVWPSAQKAQQQVTSVAQEVFHSRKQVAEGGSWNGSGADEMVTSLVDYESIMNEFRLT